MQRFNYAYLVQSTHTNLEAEHVSEFQFFCHWAPFNHDHY